MNYWQTLEAFESEVEEDAKIKKYNKVLRLFKILLLLGLVSVAKGAYFPGLCVAFCCVVALLLAKGLKSRRKAQIRSKYLGI